MDAASTNGMMDRPMRVPGNRIRSTAREPTIGQMVDATQAAGKTITCMVGVSTLGRMVDATKVTT